MRSGLRIQNGETNGIKVNIVRLGSDEILHSTRVVLRVQKSRFIALRECLGLTPSFVRFMWFHGRVLSIERQKSIRHLRRKEPSKRYTYIKTQARKLILHISELNKFTFQFCSNLVDVTL